MMQMNLSMKQKQIHRHREQIAGCQRGGGVVQGMEREFPGSICKLLYIEWINSKLLLHSAGNCSQYPVINHHGKGYERQCM